ncbi:hypothetical protein T492DRAFT_922985 [Pavlovales sp. CCMP2436]|nr:hypothetical protein T492DRAFT_922985 [Pavlovales sp. CCMP2436]
MEPKRTRRLRAHRDYSLPHRPRSSHQPLPRALARSRAAHPPSPPPHSSRRLLCAPSRRKASHLPSPTRASSSTRTSLLSRNRAKRHGARHPGQPRRAARATAAARTRRHRCAPRQSCLPPAMRRRHPHVGAPRMLACTLGPQLHTPPHPGLFVLHRTRPRAVQARVTITCAQATSRARGGGDNVARTSACPASQRCNFFQWWSRRPAGTADSLAEVTSL